MRTSSTWIFIVLLFSCHYENSLTKEEVSAIAHLDLPASARIEKSSYLDGPDPSLFCKISLPTSDTAAFINSSPHVGRLKHKKIIARECQTCDWWDINYIMKNGTSYYLADESQDTLTTDLGLERMILMHFPVNKKDTCIIYYHTATFPIEPTPDTTSQKK